MRKLLVFWALVVSALTAVVFLVAGTYRDPWLWAYVAAWGMTTFYGVSGLDDDLARERFRPPERSADCVALAFVRLFGVAHVIVGALDSGRWHIAPVPSALRAVSLAAMALTFGMFYRAMHENHFFSAVVRLQRDRAHRVVDTGPYAIVRHPGYLGLILGMPFSGLALGSFLSAGIGLVLTALIVRRVLFEDAFLRRNLEGYAVYATRVRHRLVPGVW
jgi:protein-S-isoprenylcysteine O-methyltransferase Ste14